MFFKRGVTKANLNSGGTVPSRRQRFISFVIGLIRISIRSMNRKLGKGSREQDFLGDFFMVFNTSSSVTGLKQEKFDRLTSSGVWVELCSSFCGNDDLIFWIFSVKNSEKDSATESGLPSGRVGFGERCKILFIDCQSFLESSLFSVIRLE